MVDVTRLKQQKGSFVWIHVWAIERKVLCRTHEGNVGLDIVEAAG